jgi:hypothetical protein
MQVWGLLVDVVVCEHVEGNEGAFFIVAPEVGSDCFANALKSSLVDRLAPKRYLIWIFWKG